MDAATLEEVLELAARARELEERGQFGRAADKLSAAAALAQRGAPPDCLIAPSLRLELLKALSAHAQSAAVPIEEGMAVEKRVLDEELPVLVALLERRRVAATLLPGACRPAEEDWYRQHLVRRSEAGGGGGAVSDATARAFGPLVGYAALLGAAALAVTKLELAVQRRRAVTDALRAHCAFVEAAAEALASQVHPTRPQLCPIAEAQLVAQLGRVADVPVPALAVHELGRRLCATWHMLLDGHVAAQRGLDSLRSQAEQRDAAAAAARAASRLRRCALPGCGACEASPGAFSLCAACRGAAYCGKAHQVEAWPGHKSECKAARKAAEALAGGAQTVPAAAQPPPKGRRK